MNIVIPLKALSVNRAWQGRRFKSKDYKEFEEAVSYLLKNAHQIKGTVEMHYTFYIKNYGMTDIDNLIKPIQDIIVKKGYIEDDRKIIYLTAEKIKDNDERIEIEIRKYEIDE